MMAGIFRKAVWCILSFGFCSSFCFEVLGRSVDTFYGTIEVEDQVVLDLIDCDAMQRLKEVHQYGVAYYTTHTEEYSRYDHSIGVYALLKKAKRPLKEQVAGLLHDVSHTVFSHVGDWMFGKEHAEKAYQDSIHEKFLKESGIVGILEKYGFTAAEMEPLEETFPALESKLPNLCADRLDYNIQGAYYRGFLTREEARALYEDMRYEEDKKRWVATRVDLVKKIAKFSVFMTQDSWGSPINHMLNRWLADALLRGVEVGCLTCEELHFGTDNEVWKKLTTHNDPIIRDRMEKIRNHKKYIKISEVCFDVDVVVRGKFRGINPWVLVGANYYRLTEIDLEYAEYFIEGQTNVKRGWGVNIIDPELVNK